MYGILIFIDKMLLIEIEGILQNNRDIVIFFKRNLLKIEKNINYKIS